MEHVSHWIKSMAAFIGAVIGWLYGELDGVFYALLAFVVIDYITGVIAAAIEKKLDSMIGFRGIAKKVFVFALVAIAHVIDAHVLGKGDMVRSATIFFYLSNEGLSIIENTVRIGLPVPKALTNVLHQLSKKGSDDDESE